MGRLLGGPGWSLNREKLFFCLYEDLSRTKTGPALIISSNEFNRISRTVIVVEITSNLKSGFKELNVLIEDKDVRRYPGIKPIIKSTIKLYMISYNHKVLSEEKLDEVFDKLKKGSCLPIISKLSSYTPNFNFSWGVRLLNLFILVSQSSSV
ncbi:type II toxin-antitoxin system PemK/MazF family toxin [Pyrococcus kukulkanii]|uniref:type II toxin-antitoxin system PemK/MazF family toxin n=1 Tax=Pyrococcus kukulkanii TaxID=1609559 RepID=UPI003566D7F1